MTQTNKHSRKRHTMQAHNCAPVVLFAFNRPSHLERTLEALASNDLAADTHLHIHIDGPRSANDIPSIVGCAKIAARPWKFATVKTQVRDSNQGLAASIISGVTAMLEQYGRVIVVEDDLVTSRYFLQYMNDGLTTYADEQRVASIHGWCFPHAVQDPPETFFLRGADCWGWATWQRAWNYFEPDSGILLKRLADAGLNSAFDVGDSYPYVRMLQDQHAGRVNSWAIRWHAATFLENMYTLNPGRSLVHNIGIDGSGTHCGTTHMLDVALADTPIRVERQPVLTNIRMNAAHRTSLRRTYGNKP